VVERDGDYGSYIALEFAGREAAWKVDGRQCVHQESAASGKGLNWEAQWKVLVLREATWNGKETEVSKLKLCNGCGKRCHEIEEYPSGVVERR
jgi:hypothetical protein